MLLRWGTSSGTGAPMVTDDRSKLAHGSKAMTEVMQYGENSALWTATYQEARFGSLKPFMRRVLPLGSNPLVLPIPAMGGGVAADPVGRDIADIDRILTKIHDDCARLARMRVPRPHAPSPHAHTAPSRFSCTVSCPPVW